MNATIHGELAHRYHVLVREHAELERQLRVERDRYARSVYLIDSNDVFHEACQVFVEYFTACERLEGQS